MRPVALALAAGLLTGCAVTAPPAGCTMIGSQTGIAVTVERDLAGQLHDLSLTVCVGEDCTDHPVTLQPGATVVPDPCPSTKNPDAACSATSTPDGTETGFVVLDQLPAGTVRVSAAGRLGANALTLAATQVQVQATYPNGTSCPAGGNQARVSLSSAGIR